MFLDAMNSRVFFFCLLCCHSFLMKSSNVSDTSKVIALIAYGESIYQTKPDSALWYFQKAEKLADSDLLVELNPKIIYVLKKYKALAINNQGFMIYEFDVNQALNKFKEALLIREAINDVESMSESYGNLSTTYNSLSQYDNALVYAFKGLRLDEKINDKNHIGYSYNSIGSIYYDLADGENSLKYHLLALSAREKIGDEDQIAISCNNINNAYILLGEYVKAEPYIKQAIKIWEKKKNYKNLSSAYSNYGAIFQKTNKLDSALVYILKAIEIREKYKDKRGLASSFNNVARVYYELKQYDKSEIYGLKAFDLSEQIKSPIDVMQAAEILNRVYDIIKNDSQAYKYFKVFVQINDSVKNISNQKSALKEQLKYEIEKKDALNQAEIAKREYLIFKNEQSLILLEKENDLKQLNLYKSHTELLAKKNESKIQQQQIEMLNKDKALKEVEAIQKEQKLKQQQIFTLLSIASVIVVLAFLFFVWRGYRQKKKSNEIIAFQKMLVEEKQKEVIDSINYAKRIQKAILPNEKYIDKKLNDLNSSKK